MKRSQLPQRKTPLKRSTEPIKRTQLKRSETRIKPRSARKLAEVDEHSAVREAVFKRDGYRCRLAGDEYAGPCMGALTFHHRRKAGQGGEYTEANGAALCVLHNDRLESDADLAAHARLIGLVLRTGDTP